MEKRKDSRGRNLRDGETQLQDGRYKYQYTAPNGDRKAVYSWKLVSTDRTPAGKRDGQSLREKEADIAADTHDGITSQKITLNTAFDRYMSTKVNLKQSTATNYRYMYRQYVQEALGKRTLQSIRYSDIMCFYTALVTEKGFKPNSLDVINNVLHPIFTVAVRDGHIRSNPTNGVMGELRKTHDWEPPKRHALTIEEQTSFIRFISESEQYAHWLPMFTVFLGTGCRVGEVIGLRWEDCDFEGRSISINHQLIYRMQDDGHMEFHITTPKTLAGCRIIPMMDEVRRALLQEKMAQFSHGGNPVEIDGYSGFVFTNRFGELYTPHTVNRAIERIVGAYNERETDLAETENREPALIRHFTVHNLRHTFCTRFCENETNVKVIQDIMGHADIKTTMNVYAEAQEGQKREAVANLEGKMLV